MSPDDAMNNGICDMVPDFDVAYGCPGTSS
jgi:hypothetical protein